MKDEITIEKLIDYVRVGAATEWGMFTLHRYLCRQSNLTPQDIKDICIKYGFTNYFDFMKQSIKDKSCKSDYIIGQEAVLKEFEYYFKNNKLYFNKE